MALKCIKTARRPSRFCGGDSGFLADGDRADPADEIILAWRETARASRRSSSLTSFESCPVVEKSRLRSQRLNERKRQTIEESESNTHSPPRPSQTPAT